MKLRKMDWKRIDDERTKHALEVALPGNLIMLESKTGD